MKKALSLILTLLMAAALFGCGNAVIYEEETAVNTWLKERTQGYTQIAPSSRMVLFQEEEGFKIRIDTGSDMIPKLTVENDKTNTVALDNSILTVTAGDGLYAKADHTSSVFDPYKNRYTRAMQVYQKDGTTFRIFFWLYGSATDFYPIPQLLTSDQYDRMLKILEDYTAEKLEETEAVGETNVNYTGDFMALYKSYYFTDKAKNPGGTIFYEYNGTPSEHLLVYRNLFSQLEMTEQDWRKSFEDLGYTGQKLDLQIVYCDLVVGTDTVDLSLQTSDAYTSALLQSKNLTLTYAFCPSLSQQDYIRVEVK